MTPSSFFQECLAEYGIWEKILPFFTWSFTHLVSQNKSWWLWHHVTMTLYDYDWHLTLCWHEVVSRPGWAHCWHSLTLLTGWAAGSQLLENIRNGPALSGGYVMFCCVHHYNQYSQELCSGVTTGQPQTEREVVHFVTISMFTSDI